MGFAEPGTLAAAEIAGHAELFVENFLRPLAGFGCASLRLQEERVVVIRLGVGGCSRGLLKQSGGFFRLPGLSVSMSQQTHGAMEIIVGLGGDDTLEIGDGGGEIA
jgi:hypothetical protein